jgi:hypothetical protein
MASTSSGKNKGDKYLGGGKNIKRTNYSLSPVANNRLNYAGYGKYKRAAAS